MTKQIHLLGGENVQKSILKKNETKLEQKGAEGEMKN